MLFNVQQRIFTENLKIYVIDIKSKIMSFDSIDPSLQFIIVLKFKYRWVKYMRKQLSSAHHKIKYFFFKNSHDKKKHLNILFFYLE